MMERQVKPKGEEEKDEYARLKDVEIEDRRGREKIRSDERRTGKPAVVPVCLGGPEPD